MKHFKKHRLILVVFLAGLFILGIYLAREFPHLTEPGHLEVAHGSSDDNVTGWAWGGGDDIAPLASAGNGWISFNCTNTNCTDSDYGVDIDSSTGDFEGHAWAGGVEDTGGNVGILGWISFNRSDTDNPPEAPYNGGSGPIANVDFATGRVRGWMRVLAACQDNLWDETKCTGSGAGDAAGGWDGWIKLGDDSGNWYGTDQKQVRLDLTTDPKEFCGWAWGSDVVGWISFNINCSEVCDDGTGVSNGVEGCLPVGEPLPPDEGAKINFPPTASYNSITWNTSTDSRHPILYWNFDGPETGDFQEYYQLQIASKGFPFSTPVLDTGVVYTSEGGTNYTFNIAHIVPGAIDDFDWSKSYQWRVRVKDSAGNWSIDWTNPSDNLSVSNFTLPTHAFPDVSFTRAPDQPSAEENVSLRDSSRCYDSTTYIDGRECSTTFGDSYVWDFTRIEGIGDVYYDGAPLVGSINVENPVVSFSDPSKWNVTLEITDSSGEYFNGQSYTNSTTKPVTIREPLPWWKEIIPR